MKANYWRYLMTSSCSKHVILAASLLCFGLYPGGTSEASTPENEFLDMDLSQLMNVTITSVSKKKQRLSEAAAAVYVITQEDIRRSGVTHIAEALAMAPGIQVARISASKWSVSSRGFAGYTSNKLLVLMDGRSVYSPAYSGTFWDMQNTLLEDIDRIEVIRGPGGTIWGANAVNGVINIITKKSADAHGGLVRVGAGDQESAQAAARFGGALNPKADGRVYLSGNDRSSNTLASDGSDANDGWRNIQGGFRLDGQPESHSEWTLQGDLYQNRADQILYPYWIEGPPYLTSNYGDIDAGGANLLGRYRHELSDSSVITVQAYYDYNDREESYYRQTFNTIDVDLQYETLLGEKNSITMGAGYRQIKGEFDTSFQLQLEDDTDRLYSAFLQDQLKLISDKLWLTMGVKLEHNDNTGNEWQPSGRILWKPVENHSLWASVARAVRTPSMIEENGRILAAAYPTPSGLATTYVQGSSSFESETALAYEAGYRWQATSTLSLDTAFFYNEYDKLYNLFPIMKADGLDLAFINGSSGDGYGFEAAIDWKPAPWLSFALTYSYLNMNLAPDKAGNSIAGDANFVNETSPSHQFSLRSSVDVSRDWQANFWLRYTDEITNRSGVDLLSDGILIDSYFLFDVNIIWIPTDNLEVMLAGQSVFSGGQVRYSSELVTPATEIEQGVYVKLTYRF